MMCLRFKSFPCKTEKIKVYIPISISSTPYYYFLSSGFPSFFFLLFLFSFFFIFIIKIWHVYVLTRPFDPDRLNPSPSNPFDTKTRRLSTNKFCVTTARNRFADTRTYVTSSFKLKLYYHAKIKFGLANCYLSNRKSRFYCLFGARNVIGTVMIGLSNQDLVSD